MKKVSAELEALRKAQSSLQVMSPNDGKLLKHNTGEIVQEGGKAFCYLHK